MKHATCCCKNLYNTIFRNKYFVSKYKFNILNEYFTLETFTYSVTKQNKKRVQQFEVEHERRVETYCGMSRLTGYDGFIDGFL